MLRVREKTLLAKMIAALQNQRKEPNILKSNQSGFNLDVISSMKLALVSPFQSLALWLMTLPGAILVLLLFLVKPYLLPPRVKVLSQAPVYP